MTDLKLSLKILSGMALLAACSSLDSDGGRILKFKDDVTVLEAGGSKSSVKKGESIPLPAQPINIESPGHIGLLVIPVTPAKGEVEISLKPVEEFGGSQFNRAVNSRLNEILSKVVDAQKLLASGKAREALGIIENLQEKNSELTYLNFLKASCLVVLGERSRAREALDAALASFPDNEAGKALLNQIDGSGKSRKQ